MVQDVEEVHTDFKFIVFPRRERHLDRFGETEIEPVPARSTQRITSHDSCTDVGIDYETRIVESNRSDEIIRAIAGWRHDIAECVNNRHGVGRRIEVVHRRTVVGGYAVAVDVKAIQISCFDSS